jgi:hypothetical protein
VITLEYGHGLSIMVNENTKAIVLTVSSRYVDRQVKRAIGFVEANQFRGELIEDMVDKMIEELESEDKKDGYIR